MRRIVGIPCGIGGIGVAGVVLAAAAAACGQSQTGAHVYLRLGQLQYDELRLGVTRPATGETIVDPATAGRYAGPFGPGDQDTIIYLPDALDGAQLRCAATALGAGAPVGAGAGDMLVARGVVKDVEIVMGPSGSPPDSRKSTGRACSVGSKCLTGHCVDGVCCESDCQAACRSCALPDTPGLCRPVPGGRQDPRGKCADKGAQSCQGTGRCDVAGDCAVYPAGTICQLGGCSENGRDVVPVRLCDGAGNCGGGGGEGDKMHCPDGSSCVAGICL